LGGFGGFGGLGEPEGVSEEPSTCDEESRASMSALASSGATCRKALRLAFFEGLEARVERMPEGR